MCRYLLIPAPPHCSPTPTPPDGWSPPTGCPATSAAQAWPSSSPTRTCCSTTPATSPGAVKIDWHTDLNDPHVRDYITGEQFAELMNRKGIARDDTVVIYGDKSNWWAAYALWVFTLFGHPDVRLLDGGRNLWISDGRDTTLDVPSRQTTGYPRRRARRRPDPRVQGGRPVGTGQAAADRRAVPAGVHRRTHPHARLPRGRRAARRPHPDRGVDPVGQGRAGQRQVPQRPPELEELYADFLDPENKTVVYCRIGERSSHTWFVLTHLLGLPGVRNYDGSWTEWGQRGARPPRRGGRRAGRAPSP